MAGRRTNLALLALLAAALGTGFLGFAVGTPQARWVVAGHGAVGVAIVLLAPWKSVVARRGLRRRRRGRWVSVALSVMTVVALLTGFLHAGGMRGLPLGLTVMQVHVGAALAAMLVGAWHVLARPTRPRRADLGRRNVLRTGTLAGAAAVGWVGLEGLSRIAGTRGADRRFTGSHEVGSGRPGAMPVTQWLFDPVPQLDAETWRLRVGDRLWGEEELAGFDDRVTAVLDCTGGWYARQDWSGVRLERLFGSVEDAATIVVRSATGYARRFPMSDAPRLLLATGVAGAPLSTGHGYPARLVAPGRRGFWWVKWVTSIELTDDPWWLQPPFPLQ